MKSLAPILFVFILPILVPAETATNEAILAELKKLNANLEQIEQRLNEIDQRVDVIENMAVTSAATAGPPNPSLVDRMVEAVQLRQESVRYPWMDSALWVKVKEGMSEDEVIAILGDSTLDDPSLHKRIDKVYTYRGRRPMTGERVEGKIKFYKNKVVAIEAP